MIKTHKVRIYPNSHMLKVIEDLCSYSRYCYNLALETWNDQYDASVVLKDKSLRPTRFGVQKELTRNKEDWQYNYSSRVLRQAVANLAHGWKNFFNPNMPDSKKPKFKSAKHSKQGFATDTATIKGNKLILDRPRFASKDKWYAHKGNWYGIRMSEPIRLTGKIKLTVITKDIHGYSASLVVDTEDNEVPVTKGIVGIDANIKRFNYGDKKETIIYPKKLGKLYDRIGHYQRMLAHKRIVNPTNFRSKNYATVRAKLQRDYFRVSRMQSDILHKFTYYLTHTYNEIHIEDLDVKHMQMSRRIGKNLHRSLFRRFREQLTYKCSWYHNKLVVLPRTYPSTQLCSKCGFRKTKDGYGGKQTLSGDSIHHEHQTYYCYNCGAVLDRDENAVENIKNYVA